MKRQTTAPLIEADLPVARSDQQVGKYRPKRRWRDWYVFGILLGFAGFCLGPSLIGLRTLLSVNVLTSYFPWAAGGTDTIGHQLCSTDTIDSEMPGIAHVRDQLFSGHLASWQGLIGGGSALSSVPDLGLLNPLSLPYFVMPLWLAPAFVALLSMVAAVGGTFLFLRRVQVGRPAAMLGGLAFASSGFLVMWTNWPQARVTALIPALFWATERLLQRVRALDAVLLALVVASMIFGGFPAITGWALYLAAGYFLFRLVKLHGFALRNWARTIALAAMGLILGALLTMVQLLPFVFFFQHAGLDRGAQSTEGLSFSSLITALVPNAYGLCIGGRPLYGSAGNPFEVVAYVGAAALVLAVAGAAFGIRRGGPGRDRDPRRRGIGSCFLVATVVIVVLAWGPAAVRHVSGHLPVFEDNSVGRIRSVLGFTVAVLAALGFDWLTGDAAVPPRLIRVGRSRLQRGLHRCRRLWPALVWVAAAVTGVVILWQATKAATTGGYSDDLRRASWIPLVLLAIVLALVGASRMRHGGQTAAFLLIPVLVAAQGAQFFHTVLPGDSKANFYPETGAHEFLASHLGDDRFAGSGQTLYPSTGLFYGLRTPTGHAFQEPAWVDLLQAVDPHVMGSPTFSDFSPAINQTNIGTQPVLDQMGVKYFVLPPTGLSGQAAALPAANGSLTLGGGTASCSLPAQPLRGVEVKLTRPLVPESADRGATVRITVRDGGRVVSSGRYQNQQLPTGSVFAVALAGENLPRGGTATITVTETGAVGGIHLATLHGQLICSPVTPLPDHLKLVYADPGSVIYQRLTALPRIRWASRAVVTPGTGAQVAALEHPLAPGNVILDTPGPTASGKPASVSVQTDSDDLIRATVDAEGAGYLVVADAMQQKGWSVTVDGRAATLVPADHAMVAVAIPQGKHLVELRYQAPGQKVGGVVSAAAVIVTLTVLGWEWRRRHA